MLYKILPNIYQPLQSKLTQFTKPIHITRHIAHKNDRSFVVARYNTYQFSQCFTYSTIHLWNTLPNEAVFAVRQDYFIALAKLFLLINN